jgi:hypothetical protein
MLLVRANVGSPLRLGWADESSELACGLAPAGGPHGERGRSGAPGHPRTVALILAGCISDKQMEDAPDFHDVEQEQGVVVDIG